MNMPNAASRQSRTLTGFEIDNFGALFDGATLDDLTRVDQMMPYRRLKQR